VAEQTRVDLLAAATHRPWKLDGGSVSRAIIYGNIRDGVARTFVCEIDTSWESDAAASADADAELIVAAVNEYEALLAIAEHLRETFRGWHPDTKALQLLARLDEVRRG
jgi:hypothetical protein